ATLNDVTVATFTDPGGNELPSGLVAWYQGENNAIDAAGADNNGTVHGGVTYTTGQAGRGFNLDGASGTYISAGNAANLQISTGTIDAWVQTTDLRTNLNGNFHGILVKQFAYGLFVRNGNLVAFDWGSSTTRDTGVFIADGQFHHVAMTFQSGVAGGTRIYVDGALALTTTITVLNQGQPLDIGAG